MPDATTSNHLQPPATDLMSRAEVAARLGVCETTVRDWVAQNAMPLPVRMGKFRRWRRAELEQWIAGLERIAG